MSFTKEQMKELREKVFFSADGRLHIRGVTGDVEGDVEGNVGGSVKGSVGGHVGNNVYGYVYGDVLGIFENFFSQEH